MTYIKQSKAKELIQQALDAVKSKSTFQMKKIRGRYCIFLDGENRTNTTGSDWAQAIMKLIQRIKPPTPVVEAAK